MSERFEFLKGSLWGTTTAAYLAVLEHVLVSL